MEKGPRIFGPNGSVLNSETMSDELREKYQPARAYTISAKQIVVLSACFIAPLIIVALGIHWFVNSSLAPENELHRMLIILSITVFVSDLLGLIQRTIMKSTSPKS